MTDLIKLLVTPTVIILACLLSGLVISMVQFRRPRPGKSGLGLIAIGISALYLLSINPVANLLVYSLESKYRPVPAEDVRDLDAIVILGGGYLPSGEFRAQAEATGSTYSRLFNGVEIFKRSGSKALVVSGASPRPFPRPAGETDAEVMKELAARLGVPENRIILEAKSRTTADEAVETAKLFPPDNNMRLGIVTSALHMYRAEKSFIKKFSKESILVIPVNYVSSPPSIDLCLSDFIPSVDNLELSSLAIHEMIGMVWYWLKGAV